MKIPKEYEERIGKPQRIARIINLDGREIVVRIQKPFEERPEDLDEISFSSDEDGNVEEIEEWRQYGICLIIECWSEATNTVFTDAIIKSEGQSDEEFSFGVRFMMNNGSDEEIIDIIKAKKLDKLFHFTCRGVKANGFVEPTLKET